MVQQISKPGVEITQVFQGTAPTPTSPDLIPCIVGPAFEVVDLTGSDGLASSESKLTNAAGDVLYQQLPISISPSDYPTPRADSSQMSVLADEVQVGLDTTSSLNQLDRNPGTAFLQFANLGHQPAIFIPGSEITTSGNAPMDRLILSVDVLSKESTVSDHVINVNSDLSIFAENINSAVGQTVAYKKTLEIDSVDTEGLLLKSNRFGAAASITIRSASGSTSSNFLAIASGDNGITTIRVEGAGLHAQDVTAVGVTTSPYVIHSTGHRYGEDYALLSDSAVLTLATTKNIHFYQYDVDGNPRKNEASSVSFTGSDYLIKGATPTSNGDLLTASNTFGQSITSVMVIEARSDRLRLGVVDTTRSQYDAEGNPTDQRYLDFQLGELSQNPTPFAPKNGFVIAQSLQGLNPLASPAYIESSDLEDNITDALPASLVWSDVSNDSLAANVGQSFTIQLSDGPTTTTHSFQVSSTTNTTSVVVEMEQALGALFDVSFNSGTLTISSVSLGDQVSMSISGAHAFGTLASTSSTGADTLLANIDGEDLVIVFNAGSKVHTIRAQSNSIPDLIQNVNQSVGADVLSYDADSHTLKLSSYLLGVASSVSLGSGTHNAFGFSGQSQTAGTGRPNPDVFVNSAGNISIAPEITRSPRSGQPLNVSSSIHVAYRALRLDLSASANTPGLIKISNTTDLESIYGPISLRNPLALGIYFALLNAGTGTEVSALGLDDISESEPDGTSLAYKRALEFLQSYEVYALSPLTRSEDVIQMFDAHVKSMSDPTNRAERIVISAPINPTRRNDEVVLSTGATGAQSTGNASQIDLNVSPESVLASRGIDTSISIPFALSDDKQLYVSLTIGDATYRYSVSEVDGARITIRTDYSSSQNGDGFYSVDSLPSEFVGASFSLALRGTLLTLPSSDLLDKTTYSETIRDKAQQYLNRRQLRLYPDQVQSSAIGGIDTALPSFYFASALAGACANVEPQEPLTRVPLVGFNDVIGPQLDRSHLNTISAGNAVVEVDIQGQAPSLRMQGTTDPSTIESREWSVTRAVDFFAKQCRQQLKLRIGRFNITQAYLDDLTILVDSLCRTATQNGLFRGASVDKLEQDPTQPDTILVEITLEVLYPANYIKLTLVV